MRRGTHTFVWIDNRRFEPLSGYIEARSHMNKARNPNLITAYTTIAVVAVGMLANDIVHRTRSKDDIPDLPAHTVFIPAKPADIENEPASQKIVEVVSASSNSENAAAETP